MQCKRQHAKTFGFSKSQDAYYHCGLSMAKDTNDSGRVHLKDLSDTSTVSVGSSFLYKARRGYGALVYMLFCKLKVTGLILGFSSLLDET